MNVRKTNPYGLVFLLTINVLQNAESLGLLKAFILSLQILIFSVDFLDYLGIPRQVVRMKNLCQILIPFLECQRIFHTMEKHGYL